MKYLKKYKENNILTKFKVGDIVLVKPHADDHFSLQKFFSDSNAISFTYKDNEIWIGGEEKYEIVEISKKGIMIKNLNDTMYDREALQHTYFDIDDFISLENWEIQNSTDKYNI